VTGGMGEDLGGARLPILFRIADFAEKLVLEPELGLVEYLRRFYRQWEGGAAGDGDAVAELLLSKMVTGDCLLLLDGLDEVLDGEYRGRVVRAIDRLVSDYGSNKFVITSRIAGYQEAALGSRFREFTITPMGNEQIKNFLGRWCLAIEKGQRPEEEESLQVRDAERESAGIFHAIETKPGVKRFAANPLLLTILALIHRNGTQMPQRRVELYELATKTLIEDWQLGRVASYRVAAKQLTLVDEQVTELLAPLAFRMHDEKSSGVVTQAELEEWLVPLMEESQGVEAEEALALVREFLRKVRETTGLFVERGPGVYGFMHLTFEEYYAARHIADNDVSDILAMIRPYLYEARWNEPILLALGYLSADRNQVNRLLERLFAGLVEYQPIVVGQEIRLKNATTDPVLVWHSEPEGEVQESAIMWKDLLFAGQVLAEVKAAAKFGRKQVDKLVLTYLGLDEGYGKESIQQLLRLFRGIESFNGQVLERLQKSSIDEQLSEEQRDRTVAAILYVVCGEAGDRLVDRITEIVEEITPSLFNEIRNLMAELGLEMTPSLERTLEDSNLDAERRRSLEFITGLSYLRSENYDRAIERLQPLANRANCHLDGFIDWAIAIAYENKEQHEQGLKYYKQCSDKLKSIESLILWRNWGVCYRSHKKYEKSIECFEKALSIGRKLADRKIEAFTIWHLGKTYQDWKKYEEAITKYELSREIFRQIDRPINVANQWYWIANCYKDWNKYEKAIEFQQQCLELRRLEEDESRISLSLYQLGRIYHAWGKYEEAIDLYEQSRDLDQQLEKKKDVANLWYWIADCYSDWGKYDKAIEAGEQNLSIHEQLESHINVALSCFRIGKIYQAATKYNQAVLYYKKSLSIYQELGLQQEVAHKLWWLADCYGKWGRTDEAILSYRDSRKIYETLNLTNILVRVIFQLSNYYAKIERYEEAIQIHGQGFIFCEQHEEREYLANAHYELGRIYQSWCKYSIAIEKYQKSCDIYQQLDKNEDVANLWYWIGNSYKDWGQYEKAIESQQKCLALRQLEEDELRVALSLYQLGHIYQAWSKYEEALDYYQRSRGLYQQLEKEKDVANQWYEIGDCYKKWGKYEKAIEHQQQCLELRRLEDDESRVALSLYQLGGIYQAWGKYEQAIDHYQQSRDLYQQLEKKKNVSNQWYWIGDCYKAWGKYEQAIESQQQCLELKRREEDESNIALSLYQLGGIYQAWGKYKQAIDYHQQSRDLYQQLEKKENVSNQLYWIGDCYKAWGKYEQAIEHQQQCLELRRLEDNESRIALSLYQLGGVYQTWGRYEEATEYYQQSRDLYQKLEERKNAADLCYWIADCYRHWNRYTEALESSQQYLIIYQELDNQSEIAIAYRQFGRIYQAYENYTEAIEYHQQSLEIYQQFDKAEDIAIQLRRIAHNQRKLAQETADRPSALTFLNQAEQNLQQAIQLNTENDYQKNLAYDRISLSLLYADRLRHPETDTIDLIHQFETNYPIGLAALTDLGQTVSRAEETLDIARAYLEIPALQNLALAETLASRSLETFQEFDRRKLQANAHKLLGEIYSAMNDGEAGVRSFQQSREIYVAIDLPGKVEEVERLME
jgi:tetratricopeptide (TPR) repeat protein